MPKGPKGEKRPADAIGTAIKVSRRSLLGVLFSLGGLTVLLSACKHRPSYSEQKKPETGTGTNGGGAGGGY